MTDDGAATPSAANVLKSAREARGLSVGQVAEELRLTPAMIDAMDAARWSDAQIARWREERRDLNLLHQALEAPKSALHKAPAAELVELLDSGASAQAAVVAAKGPKSMDRALRQLASRSSELDHYT